MEYRIARESLLLFVERQVVRIQATPLPPDLRQIVPVSELGDDELAAVWLGAGLATQVGLAILDAPERFIEPVEEPMR
jgi:hypothetical protein